MNNPVLLFSGQGAQRVGMGADLAEKYPSAAALLQTADDTLNFSLRQVMFDGPETELTRTGCCQPALYVHGLMCLAALHEEIGEKLVPSAAAGLSLGEFTAHAAAETFDFATGLQIVAKRGELMEQACEKTEGSMAALIGGDNDGIKKLANEFDIDIANYNAPGQTVISGEKDKITRAIAMAKSFGIRMAKELNVAGAYHSRLMQSAQDSLAPVLGTANLQTPKIPVIANFSAQPANTADDIRHCLSSQVTGSVRWVESIEYLIKNGANNFIELGPGRVLAGLIGRIDKTVTVISIDDTETLSAALPQLKS